MTNIENKNIPLINIESPSLGDSNYASSIEKAFNNINENFKILSNHDFIKGDKGESVEIKTIDLVNDLEWKQKLEDFINTLGNDNDKANIEIDNNITIGLFDKFNQNPGSLQLIYNTENNEPISSLYYVFLDGRFSNKYIGKIDNIKYQGIKDLSCIIVYNNDEFKALTNAFPTIYYENNVGLCWKINGAETGIHVQGIPGKDGENSKIIIAKCKINENKKYEVKEIYSKYDGYLNISDIENDIIMSYDNTPAVILLEDGNFYFGYLELIETKLIAMPLQEYPINNSINTQVVINAMKNINILSNGEDGSNSMKGLFIPIEKNSNDKQAVHLITSTSVKNNQGDKTDTDNLDLIFTSINDINSLKVNNNDLGIDLGIERYLYMKISNNNIKYKLLGLVESNAKKYYVWEYCVIKHNFDTEELKNEQKNNESYIFNSYFNNVLYTDVINPKSSLNIYVKPGQPINNISSPTIEYIKFTPIFNINDDIKYNEDLSLNINYDVNILGNTKSNKNLNVNGVVNCDELNVYKKINTDNLNTKHIVSKNLFTTNFNSNNISLNGNINIDKPNNMKLIRNTSNIISDIPLVQHNNSNIIISNTENNGLCYYGAPTITKIGEISLNAGTGVTNDDNEEKITTINFEHVKNFNMYKLAADNVDTKTDYTTTKHTTLCEDGIVIKSDKYVFGLGYAENIFDHEKSGYTHPSIGVGEKNNPSWGSIIQNLNNFKTNEPILFYHEFDENYYDENGNPRNIGYNSGVDKFDELSSKGYATRINAIPLKDLFNVIKDVRELKEPNKDYESEISELKEKISQLEKNIDSLIEEIERLKLR